LGQHEARPEVVARPIEHRAPLLLLARLQALGGIGAIDQKIGAEKFLDFGRDRLRLPLHAVNDRIGEPGERHARRIDHVALRLPFGGDRFGKRPRRRGEWLARRRAHRPAVEQDRKFIRPLAHMGALIEARPQLRPGGAPRRLRGIEHLRFKNVLEDVAHEPSDRPPPHTRNGQPKPGRQRDDECHDPGGESNPVGREL
jgi:hypothetical protein